jgi:membrane-associated phospholipid phosphatase
MGTLFSVGTSWVVALQGLGDWLSLPMKFFTFLGTEEFFLLILPVLYWCVDASLGLRVGVILLFSDCLNGSLKLAFHGPRPYWVSADVKPMAAETSFGVPSGHAQTAGSVWGTMASRLRKTWAWIVAGVIIFLIGLSRIYLGVHFPHDVLAGWLIGGLLLWAFLSCWELLAAWLKRLSSGRQVLVALGVSLGFILLGGLARLGLQGYVVPEAWMANAARGGGELPAPVSMSGVVSSAGVLFGLAVGVIWLAHRGGFNASGKIWKRIVRYPVGLIGIMLLWYGLGEVFPRGEMLLPFILRYLRYALVGLWLSGCAPWIFMKLKLS